MRYLWLRFQIWWILLKLRIDMRRGARQMVKLRAQMIEEEFRKFVSESRKGMQ